MLCSIECFGVELLRFLPLPGVVGATVVTSMELLLIHAKLVLAGNKRTAQGFGGFRWYLGCYAVPAFFIESVSCILMLVSSSLSRLGSESPTCLLRAQ